MIHQYRKVIGIVDCTKLRIVKPLRFQIRFFNVDKGYHCTTFILVTDRNGKILYVASGFYGIRDLSDYGYDKMRLEHCFGVKEF